MVFPGVNAAARAQVAARAFGDADSRSYELCPTRQPNLTFPVSERQRLTDQLVDILLAAESLNG